MRNSAFIAIVSAVFVLCSLASAQQGDAYIGGGTLLSSSASPPLILGTNCGISSSGNAVCPEKGADVIFKHRLGGAFDVNWKGGQAEFGGPGGQPYRPLQFTFNGVFQPRLGKKAGLDLFGGIGWQSTRFYGYTNTSNCYYFGACYTSSNHFLMDVGGGIRYYFWGHVFLRPEVRYYHIVNNGDNFTSDNVFRVGASIGYTIGPE